MKRLIISMLIVLLISVAFIGSFYKGYYSYAEDINYMSDAELEAAYQAYLQSKGGGLIGSAGARLAYTNGKMLNFLTSEYNTTPFKNINQVKGLLTWEKRELESGNSSVLQLTMRHPEVFSLYTQWLLQNHYFGNGVAESDGIFDDGVDNNLYSGKYFVDSNGNGCLVYVCTGTGNSYNSSQNYIVKRGSPYKYTSDDIVALYNNGTRNLSGSVYNVSYNWAIGYNLNNGIPLYSLKGNPLKWYGTETSGSHNVVNVDGSTAIIQINGSNSLYFGMVAYGSYGNGYYSSCFYINTPILNIPNDNLTTADINFYTNINNNITNYPDINADGTLYITPKVKVGVDYQPYTINEGDTITNVVNNYYNDSGEKDKTITTPSENPDSGSGGSGGSGGTPPNWSNPYPNLSPDGNGGFNFNFTLPDLNIDWNINGLSEKFPFSIPFDLIRFITVLNAEPETPHFEGTVNLIVYQWDIDADLSQFDNLASIVRNVEFIGFCITLILITRKMIKG